MNFFRYESELKTPFAPKFEIILLEDIVQEDFTNLKNTILEREEKIISDNEFDESFYKSCLNFVPNRLSTKRVSYHLNQMGLKIPNVTT